MGRLSWWRNPPPDAAAFREQLAPRCKAFNPLRASANLRESSPSRRARGCASPPS